MTTLKRIVKKKKKKKYPAVCYKMSSLLNNMHENFKSYLIFLNKKLSYEKFLYSIEFVIVIKRHGNDNRSQPNTREIIHRCPPLICYMGQSKL